MRLVNGKFFEGENQVPLTFGDKKQIELIFRVETLIKHGEEPFLVFDDEKNAFTGAWLTCVCDGVAATQWSLEDQYSGLVGKEAECSGCGNVYKIIIDEDELIYFKLATHEKV